MKRFVISGTAFYVFGNNLLKELSNIIQGATTHTTILDYKTLRVILEKHIEPLENGSIEPVLLTPTGDSKIDSLSISQELIKLKGNDYIDLILDCTMIERDSANQLMQKVQYNMDILNSKITSFSVICHDTEMLEYTDILSNLFRIAPLNYGEEYLELVYRHVLHRAYYIRYFEGSHILKFFLRIYQKLRRLKK